MAATLANRTSQSLPLPAWQSLPPRMRVLYIATRQRTESWLAEAFAADNTSEVLLDEAVGIAAGLERLCEEGFDVVLVGHEPGNLDSLDLIEGYRAGGADEPVIVLGTQSEQEMAVLCYQAGADGYLCVHTTTTRNLVWMAARAIRRHQLVRENHRLNLAEQTRLGREHEEAHCLLEQQWVLASDTGEPEVDFLPPELIDHYRELLRTYVIMGSGSLTGDLQNLAKLLVSAQVTARQTMQLHLHVLEEIVRGLGVRSTRHVMTRADLLVMELLVYLAEGYRLCYHERVHPPQQKTLPGFE